MATAPVIEHEPETSIVVAVTQNPALVLIDAGKRDDLFARIRSEIKAFKPDVTTNKGRAAIKSFAFKITQTKTAIDDAGKKLNEEARAKINVVDAARRDAKEALTEMAKSVRQPLTDWEEAEDARVEECRGIIDNDIRAAAIVQLSDTVEIIRQRGTDVWNIALDAEKFGDMLPEATAAKEQTVATLRAALIRLEQEEADKAELEKLRAEKEARDTADRYAAEQEAQRKADEEAKAKAARDAAEAEERRVAAEKAEADRIEQAKAEAAANAQRAAEEAAQAERDRIQAEHDEALAAEKCRADEAEAQRKAEADRIANEAAARQAEEKRLADEQAKRDKNRAHRSQIMGEAKISIMAAGKVDEAAAVAIVKAIVAGSIPHVSLRF
jgi:colicin import membrane protein